MKNIVNIDSFSYALWSSSESGAEKIQKEIDKIFDGYSFYPEFDWNRYGYGPPKQYQVLGAWRHPDAKAFVFCLSTLACLDANLCSNLYWQLLEIPVKFHQ